MSFIFRSTKDCVIVKQNQLLCAITANNYIGKSITVVKYTSKEREQKLSNIRKTAFFKKKTKPTALKRNNVNSQLRVLTIPFSFNSLQHQRIRINLIGMRDALNALQSGIFQLNMKFITKESMNST
jgi:hypothetical protein